MGWQIGNAQISANGVAMLTLEEVDGVSVVLGSYTAKRHKDRPGVVQELLADIKAQVLAARARQATVDAVASGIDLTNFETFLSQ